MSRIFRPPSQGRHRRRSRMCSCHSRVGLCAMSEPRPLEPEESGTTTKRVPFPLTDEQAGRPRRPLIRRPFMHRSMVELTLVRFREFIREPEAVFGTFIFPILLAAGLGIAFRQRGPDKIHVGIIGSTPGAAALGESLKKDSTLVVRSFDDSSGARALRTG